MGQGALVLLAMSMVAPPREGADLTRDRLTPSLPAPTLKGREARLFVFPFAGGDYIVVAPCDAPSASAPFVLEARVEPV